MKEGTSIADRRPVARRMLAGCAATLCALSLPGCQSITADSPQSAQVRFVDASVDAPGLDLYLNGSAAAYGLSFGTVSSYIPVAPGELKVSAARANTMQMLANTHTTVGGTRQYTAVVSNVLGDLEQTVYPDANAPAPAGMISVRVLNEAAGLGPQDIYLLPGPVVVGPLTPAARDLPYTGGAGYLDLPAGGSYSVAVVPAGSASAAVSANILGGIAVTGASGAVRTVVVTNSPAGKGLTAWVLDDFDTP